MSRILVTGGAGFIGSHTCVALLAAGHDVTVVDNFSNSKPEVLARIARISGRWPTFVEADVRDQWALEQVFAQGEISAVIHFAGLKAVGESVREPLRYYDNNVGGTLALLQAMKHAKVKTLVFSSSATVYGDPESLPLREDARRSATNPYGHTKLVIEDLLHELVAAEADWRIALLRYFNPIGAHESGLIGEDPRGIPNNLLPYIAQVAAGQLKTLSVFGADYDTPDGTGVRDYIHVSDLADGHLAALRYLQQQSGIRAINLGTGQGYSVLEIVRAFEKASGKKVPYSITPRRSGDVAACYADPSLAAQILGWRAQHGIERMCRDAWRWQMTHPCGYDTPVEATA
ncbi:UDP-glucose 4-epimerase GalE [Rhodocyclus tenuis]|uniref:UDP-glucose 4-epimerase GalE n=1 Tax=Rhodocyclus gracilis TaxID=2929842 RepID=UPI001298A59F|nr:UDP-glucose 4-epimerase GalE [Rhodocyclus gracilis]MRD73021.1 UDP-glucose 4-epimerase GalE [Rhodocyclus gracilis]